MGLGCQLGNLRGVNPVHVNCLNRKSLNAVGFIRFTMINSLGNGRKSIKISGHNHELDIHHKL